MRIVAIVQARMGSTRLPGKVLKPLSGITVLSHVIQRLKHAKQLSAIVVATSDLVQDDPIVEEAVSSGAEVFRGSEIDVLSRYFYAAKLHEADYVVRITSDCPLISPEIVDDCISTILNSGADYSSNALERTYPRGLDVEVFTMQALETSFDHSQEPAEREHVTPYIYRRPELFKISHVVNEVDYSKHRWTLDTLEDYNLLTEIYDRLYRPGRIILWNDVIKLLAENPQLIELNQHIEQKMVK
jgi:spore coat polysaccharide biosynthesis protein SpsF